MRRRERETQHPYLDAYWRIIQTAAPPSTVPTVTVCTSYFRSEYVSAPIAGRTCVRTYVRASVHACVGGWVDVGASVYLSDESHEKSRIVFTRMCDDSEATAKEEFR